MTNKTIFYFLLFLSTNLFAQDISFVKDNIMNSYMENGVANKRFRPKGKLDKKNQRKGFWKDYATEADFALTQIDEYPKLILANYLVYGEGEYKEGQRDGSWKLFLIEDKTFKKIHFKDVKYLNGKKDGSFKYYFPNKIVAVSGVYLNNKFEGEVLNYYNNGKLFAKEHYENGKAEGINNFYYKNGDLRIQKTYSNNILNGQYLSYYKNNVLKESFSYKKEEIDGIYKYYYSNSQLWTERLYDNGKLLEINQCFSINGIKIDYGNLKNGNGVVKYYTEGGKIYLEIVYKNGVQIDETKF